MASGVAAQVGRVLSNFGARYKRGADAPPLGDLLDTGYALFRI